VLGTVVRGAAVRGIVVVVGCVVVSDGAEVRDAAFGLLLVLLHAATPKSEMEMTWRPHDAIRAGYRYRHALPEWSLDTLRLVKAFRRLLVVLGVAGLVGAIAKLRGKGGVPPTSGGWRELEGPDFR